VATWGWALPLDGVSRRQNLRRGTSGTDNAVFRVDGALRLLSEDATSTSTFTLTPTTSWLSANQTAASASTSAAWQYLLDGRSSWTRRTKGTVPTTYTRDASDALRTINSQAVTVDARGAYKTDGAQTVTYDAFGLVKSVTQPGASRGYRRDALGRVVTETDQTSAVTKYAYDGASRILRQRPGGAIDITIDGELDEHIVTIDGGTRRFLHQDRRGSVFLSTSSTGAPLEWVKYTAYGEASITSSSINTQFGFNGLPHDFATGLVDMRARIYRPNLGRFLTPDPLGLVDGSNRFAFVGASPLYLRDPFGLSSRDEARDGGKSPLALCPTCTSVENPLAGDPIARSGVKGLVALIRSHTPRTLSAKSLAVGAISEFGTGLVPIDASSWGWTQDRSTSEDSSPASRVEPSQTSLPALVASGSQARRHPAQARVSSRWRVV
jgi:RHS repeat-associated protein